MAVALSEAVRKLLEGPNFAHLGTLMPDGSPQVTVVWVNLRGAHILINTAEGRQKPRNIRRDDRVALSVVNQENPYQTVAIRGRVVELTHDGADKHLDELSKKYLGQETYPYRQPGEQRILVRIEPQYVTPYGLD